MRKNNLIFLLALFFLGVGCQSGRELHFFKSGENYYRLNIHEYSFASKARYASGYYDDKAVDKYFSEMSQPAEGEPVKQKDVNFLVTSPAAPNNFKIDSTRQLVMFLSTNNKAATEQIGAFAENEAMLESIARLSNKDKIAESDKYQSDTKAIVTANKGIIENGDQFIKNLEDTASVDKTKRNISLFLQFLKAQDKEGSQKAKIETLINQF